MGKGPPPTGQHFLSGLCPSPPDFLRTLDSMTSVPWPTILGQDLATSNHSLSSSSSTSIQYELPQTGLCPLQPDFQATFCLHLLRAGFPPLQGCQVWWPLSLSPTCSIPLLRSLLLTLAPSGRAWTLALFSLLGHPRSALLAHWGAPQPLLICQLDVTTRVSPGHPKCNRANQISQLSLSPSLLNRYQSLVLEIWHKPDSLCHLPHTQATNKDQEF